MVQGLASDSPSARITVVFLLYRAAREVPGLVEALLQQRHPSHPNQGEWLEALFMEDASGDDTARVLEETLGRAGAPASCRVVVNPENLGLAATLNKALGLVRTPFVLTCHLDCRFGRNDYVAGMLDLLERHPRAAAITGQPTMGDPGQMPFAEKLNVVANLMDIFPADPVRELVPVGFAEGRCDAFRVEALRAVGLYDTNLRTAGEDQVLAARLREKGYEVYQAPRLPYLLSVSGEQDTVFRLARHQWLFGLAHPYILLRARGKGGVAGVGAGGNRRARAGLRLVQIASSASFGLALLALGFGHPLLAAGTVGAVVAVKALLFARHLRVVPFSAGEWLVFWLVQPLLDAAYTLGLLQGMWHVARGTARRPIG